MYQHFGIQMELPNIDKVQEIIVRLRNREDVEASKNYLIAMLEEIAESLEEFEETIERIYKVALNIMQR